MCYFLPWLILSGSTFNRLNIDFSKYADQTKIFPAPGSLTDYKFFAPLSRVQNFPIVWQSEDRNCLLNLMTKSIQMSPLSVSSLS